MIDEAVNMISYVSASGNGNSVPERCIDQPYLLWPRFSDRLEAIGTIGMVRCFQYNEECGNPLMCDTTPRPKSVEEVWAEVKLSRFDNYMLKKVSNSMMDHYYDKLLHIAVFDKNVVQNSFLIEEAARRVQPLVDVCLSFGTTGIVPVDLIKSYI